MFRWGLFVVVVVAGAIVLFVALRPSSDASASSEFVFIGASLDGTRITVLAARADGSRLRVIVPAAEGPLYPQSSDPANPSGAFVSPDGKRIAYLSRHGIAVVPSSGGEPKVIAPGYALLWGWSPDSRWLLFRRYQHNETAYIVSPDGSHLRTIHNKALISYVDLVWTPDSKSILSSSGLGVGAFDLAGNLLHEYRNAGAPTNMAFTPDGRSIVMSNNTGARDGIEIANADFTDPRWLTSAKTPAYYPSLSPDGKRIAYDVGITPASAKPPYPLIRIITLTGKKVGTIYDVGGSKRGAAGFWSQDGKHIAYELYGRGALATLWITDGRKPKAIPTLMWGDRGIQSWLAD